MEILDRTRLGGYSVLSQHHSEEYEGSSSDHLSAVTKGNDGDTGGGAGAGGAGGIAGTRVGSGSAARSWAQQAEEAYQLQLAFALRLCSQAACIAEPNFLEAADQLLPLQPVTSESLSYRFWVNGCLTYHDKIPDGFYLIQGMDPVVWALCNDMQESTRIPSIESLRIVKPTESTLEVVVIDKMVDPDLRHLHSMVIDVSSNPAYSRKDLVELLANIVCTHMGGVYSSEEHELVRCWKEASNNVKMNSGSVVFPIGDLSVGICRHRSLLFKALADLIDVPCRIARGCRYCNNDVGVSCLVRLGQREYLVDLIGNPGWLHDPDSMLNGLSSISISSSAIAELQVNLLSGEFQVSGQTVFSRLSIP